MNPAALQMAASTANFGIQVSSAVAGIYLQHINRQIEKRALERQLRRATEVSLRNTEASADMMAEVGKAKLRQQLGIEKQKVTAKGQVRVAAAQFGGSARPGLESIERQTGEAGVELAIQVDQATANVLDQAKAATQSIKDQLFSMDMSITPYDILGPVTQIAIAGTGYASSISKIKQG